MGGLRGTAKCVSVIFVWQALMVWMCRIPGSARTICRHFLSRLDGICTLSVSFDTVCCSHCVGSIFVK